MYYVLLSVNISTHLSPRKGVHNHTCNRF